MQILVTGACGYKGTVLIPKLLKLGYKVIALDIMWFGNFLRSHPNLTIIEEDVRKRGNKYCAYVDDKLTKAEKAGNPKKYKGKKVGSVQRTKSGKIRMKARACYGTRKKANNAMAAAMMSDIRMKENISQTGVSPSGIPIYQFNYKGDTTKYSGTMAQDLIKLGMNDAVSKMDNGYYGVHYNMIDVDFLPSK